MISQRGATERAEAELRIDDAAAGVATEGLEQSASAGRGAVIVVEGKRVGGEEGAVAAVEGGVLTGPAPDRDEE